MFWILTVAYNLYDQQGDYFVAGWREKPTAADLKSVAPDCDPDHLFHTGGRKGVEGRWYYLLHLEPGVNYHEAVPSQLLSPVR
jgi:hypothetical protein